mgnify:CR=1 FL=1
MVALAGVGPVQVVPLPFTRKLAGVTEAAGASPSFVTVTSASKISVVGNDSTESRRAAAGLASMSISTCATEGSSAHTWLTTLRTAAHGPSTP